MITLLRKPIKTLIIITFLPLSGHSQALEKYVDEGLKNNLVLQQKNISAESAMYSLKEARSMFLPSVSLLGDYQSGEGGRSIAFPVGDLLNPVYTTLNQMTGSNSFPHLDNVDINFLPNNYYDVKLRASMPLLNTDVIYNKKIQSSQAEMKQAEVEAYRAELTKEIKTAYFNYISSINAIVIYEKATELAREGKRITDRLAANGKAVPAYVIRSESELQQMEAKRKSAIQQSENAKMYFNFLLNADLNRSIDTTGSSNTDLSLIQSEISEEASVTRRSELKVLSDAEAAYDNARKLSSAYYIPKIAAYADYGSQASDWLYNSETRYYFAGVHFELPLFSGGQNTFKRKRAENALKNQQLFTESTTKQLTLAARAAKNNLISALEVYQSSLKTEESARSYDRLIQKGYAEGINSFIESIDARNQLTIASIQRVISENNLRIAQANYERETQR